MSRSNKRHRRVWYRVGGEVREAKPWCSAKDLISVALSSPTVVHSRYFATYHGQFVVRDAENEGCPIAHFNIKDAMIAYLTLLGGNA